MPRIRTIAPLLLVIAVLLTACSSGADTDTTDVADEASDDAGAPAADDAAAERDTGGGIGLGVGDADAATPAAPGAPPVPATNTALRGDRLIKEGTMTVEVDAGGFEAGFQRVVEAARALGGSVVSSTSSSAQDGGGTSGSVTIRVPVDRYEQLLVGVGGVGEVRQRDITTKDVTAEFTDLAARLRHARAQERFYLGLLEEAEGVQDAIAVQQQLDGLQSSIERLQGSLDVLEDRTSFSTLTVELVEPGTSPVLTASERPQLAAYVATAQDAFVTVVGSVLVVGVALVPIVVPALLILALWRGLGRRSHPATVASKA
jgi:hypothetical protein